MKKVFMLLAVAGFIVSCDNAADTEKRTKDSLDSVRVADSIRNATPVVPPVVIDSPVIKVDSPVIKVDSPKVNQ